MLSHLAFCREYNLVSSNRWGSAMHLQEWMDAAVDSRAQINHHAGMEWNGSERNPASFIYV